MNTETPSQTLLGFESVNSNLSFINGISVTDPKTDDEEDNNPIQTSITMMGFAQNHNDETDLIKDTSITMMRFAQNEGNDSEYQTKQNVMLFGKILQYDSISKSYSIQLKPNSSSSTVNSSELFTIQIPSQFIHSIPDTSNVDYNIDDIDDIDDMDNMDGIDIKHTENQNDIMLETKKYRYYEMRKHLKCILCLYASDAMNIEVDHNIYNIYQPTRAIGDICDDMFRISPFGNNNKVLSNNTNDKIKSVKKLVKYGKIIRGNIYYYQLGDRNSNPQNQLFFTPKFKWPDIYSMVIWVKWKDDYKELIALNSVLTTFDSNESAPIYVDIEKHIGCHSIHGKDI